MDANERRAAIAAKLNSVPTRQNGKPRTFGNPRPFREKPKPEGYVFGRPSAYRPEYCQEVIDCMSRGFDLSAFAGSISVTRESVYNWMNAHPDFFNAVKIGRGKRLHFLQEKLLTTKMGVGVTAAIFALKNAAPDEWQDRFETRTEVNVRIESISDQKLLEIVGASSPALIEHEATPGDATVTSVLPSKPEPK